MLRIFQASFSLTSWYSIGMTPPVDDVSVPLTLPTLFSIERLEKCARPHP